MAAANAFAEKDLGVRPLVLEGPAPCDGCRHALRCASSSEACEAFALFVKYGREERWSYAPRQPDERLGRRMLNSKK